jgi:hypothetical protein
MNSVKFCHQQTFEATGAWRSSLDCRAHLHELETNGGSLEALS